MGTFLYRLSPDDLDATNRSQVRSLEISIQATANLSSVCQPNIKMQWTTSLDFTPPVNPGFGNPTQPIQRPHRPAQLSIGSTLEATASSLAISRPDALPSIDITTRHQRNSSIPDFGVTMTFTGHGGSRKDPKVADAVVDENIIYAMQKNSAVEDTEIVCLSTDTRVGPLAPSACYDVELKFMALKVGIVGVEAVRVIDLGTQEHVDIKDLPSIIVS